MDSRERALRALQIADEVMPFALAARSALIDAQDALGEELGLTCTGVKEGPSIYAHDGETCPIHEWLCPDEDYAIAHDGEESS